MKLLFVVNVDWFFISHRLPIALAAKKLGYTIHIATSLTDKLTELQQHGLIVHPLKMDRSSTGLYSVLHNLLELWQVFKSVKPDVIHLVTIKPVLLGGIVARLAGIPAVVAAVSGLGFVFIDNGLKASIRRWLVGTLYRLAFGHRNMKVIFQNKDDLQSVTNVAPLSDQKVAMIRGSGVDLASYAHLPLPEGAPIVVLAARLLVDKGVREFIEAARTLKSRSCPARFVLVGTVDLANPASLTQHEVDNWVKEGVVDWWGHRSNMPEVLSTAQIVVLPSYREGMPKVLLEAAACGRAVITTDVPGCRDAIDPDVTGLLVPVRNTKALADAIEGLINDQAHCMELGNAGRKLAETVFDVRQVVDKHLRIYDELIGKS